MKYEPKYEHRPGNPGELFTGYTTTLRDVASHRYANLDMNWKIYDQLVDFVRVAHRSPKTRFTFIIYEKDGILFVINNDTNEWDPRQTTVEELISMVDSPTFMFGEEADDLEAVREYVRVMRDGRTVEVFPEGCLGRVGKMIITTDDGKVEEVDGGLLFIS